MRSHRLASRSTETRADRARGSRRGPSPSALDGAGKRGHVVLDEEGVDESDGDGTEEGARHERPPVEDVATHQLREHADRDRLLLRRREEDERIEELVPG